MWPRIAGAQWRFEVLLGAVDQSRRAELKEFTPIHAPLPRPKPR